MPNNEGKIWIIYGYLTGHRYTSPLMDFIQSPLIKAVEPTKSPRNHNKIVLYSGRSRSVSSDALNFDRASRIRLDLYHLCKDTRPDQRRPQVP